MQMIKWSAIAVAVAAATSSVAMANQADSKGFVEDSSFSILNRNTFIHRDYHRGGSSANYDNSSANPAPYTQEWAHGIITNFESGFTQGTVGVGVDAFTLTSIKLDSGKGRAGILELDRDSDGRSKDTASTAGAAVKFRVSNSVLKYGDQFVGLPVYSTDDSRVLPESTTGTLLTSNEIEGLEVNVGRFTALSKQRDMSTDGSAALKSANVYGASYSFTENFSGSLYASDVEDVFKKKYINLNYNLPLADDQSLNFDLNGYRTKGDGKAKDDHDNKIWSLAAAYNIGAHTLTLAHQRSSGDTGYSYGADGRGTIWLANSVQVKDFNAEEETSWQVRYDLNMASFGIPGLTFMTRYVTGDDAVVRNNAGGIVDKNATRWERDIEAKYVIQEGAAKDLSFRVRQATVRSDQSFGSGNDLDDYRLIVEYPLSIL